MTQVYIVYWNDAGARANKLMPEEFTGGCTSVSNLGMFDISEFIAGERRGICVRAELERERRVCVSSRGA